MQIITNDKKGKLVRPRSMFSRLGALAWGCFMLLLSIGGFAEGVPIMGFILLAASIGGFISFSEKYETLG